MPGFSLLPPRYRRFMPLILAAVGAAALVLGWTSDDRGYLLLGIICLAGAGFSLISTALAGNSADPDDPPAG